MKLTVVIQEALLSALCYDVKNYKQIRSLIDSKMFDVYWREIAKEVEKYIDNYDKPPGEHTLDLFEILIQRNLEEKEIYEKHFDSLQKSWNAGLNYKFLLDQASVFMRFQQHKVAAQETIRLLELANTAENPTSTLDELDGVWDKAIKQTATSSSDGLILLNDPVQALSFLDTTDEEVFPMGIKEFDERRLGPARGEYWLLAAGFNVGKSWSAVHMGKWGMITGKRILHITLEMSKKKVAQRYTQSLFSYSNRQIPKLTSKHFEEQDDCIAWVEEEIARPSLADANIREYLERKMKGLKFRPKLYIKEFPSGSLTIKTLNNFLDYMEAAHNQIFSMILLDYADLMDHDPKHKKNELEKIGVDLRGIAQKRNLAMVSFTQINREGMNKKADLKYLAADISKAATADSIFMLSQTEAEYELGFARIMALKVRNEEKFVQVGLSQNLAIGQFCIDSIPMHGKKYWSGMGQKEE